MKKRIIKLLVVVCLICSVALAVTACKGVKMTISFMVDGNEYATINTSGNEIVTIPQSPTKDGYTFDGWYWDDGTWQRPFTASSLLNEPLTSDMSVYAKFTEIHKHTYSVEWSNDERGHWHVATCEHTNETTAIEKHVYDSNYVCKICHYQDTSLHGTAIATEVFDVDGETLYAKTPNSQTTFSFINAIQVADNATFVVATDLAASNVIRTKTVSLEIGDNTYYILVENGNDIQLYTVTLRRRPIYTVTFVTNGGTSCDSQQVEEDSLAIEPTISKVGYTFANWNYDFATPVTKNTTITASWKANKYNVTYDVNGGILTDTKYTATYDSAYTFAVPTKVGHTFQGWYIDETQITDVNGQSIVNWTYTEDKTATAKWTINSYTLTITKPNSNAGMVTGDGTYIYDSEVTVTASEPNIGYDWLGWYDGDELLSTELTYTFDMPANNLALTPYKIKDEMSNFNFTSTTTSCEITSVKDNTVTEIVIPNYVTNIGSSAFNGYQYSLTMLSKVTIGDGVKSIGKYAFYHCKSLSSVTIGNSVTSIDNGVFKDCSSLTNITIGNGVTSIGNLAFGGCLSLASVTISDSVTNIAYDAFDDCNKITNINYLGTIESWCKIRGLSSLMWYISSSKILSMNGEPISDITISDNITSIPSCAFRNCMNLTSIEISNSVEIENLAFSGCNNLKSVIMGNGVTSIGSNAFA